MPDATYTVQPNDPVVSIDVQDILIQPRDSHVYYRLRLERSSGAVSFAEKSVAAEDFMSCLASFMQAAPKKKFLNWLVANGYESNLTVA